MTTTQTTTATISTTEKVEFATLFSKLGNLKTIEKMANNQVVHHHENGRLFVSYEQFCGVSFFHNVGLDNTIFLRRGVYNYSKTTSKYVNRFLNVTSKDKDKMIKNGVIALFD